MDEWFNVCSNKRGLWDSFISEEIRFKSAMQPMMPEPPLVLGIAPKYKICCYIHPYCCRETIVSKFMCEHPAFNENQDPVSKKGVIVWNGNHAKGNEMKFFTRYVPLV
jgi:hypothetical protein